MDFKTYVQSVVASYVDKQDKNIIFIKHYNTLDITREEILADVDDTSDKVFLYHVYAMHDMHSTYAPFLQWIRSCYNEYYSSTMTVEEFLQNSRVYSMHIETLAGLIRDNRCKRREDVLHFEIAYEAYRMQQDVLSILDYISKEHHLILIISKFHLAPYSSIALLRELISRTMNIHVILMYNDEFNIADYKKDVWTGLFKAVEDQNLELEWGSLDSEKTMDVQDEFWFDKSLREEYFYKLRNMYYTFSRQDALYYMNNILGRLDEKTIRLNRDEHIQLLILAAQIDMSVGQVDHALVMCDKLTDLHCSTHEDLTIRYMYYYVYAKARMILCQQKHVEAYCQKCVSIANEIGSSFLACKAEVILWSSYCGLGKDIFEYDFSYKVDSEIINKIKSFGFTNFLAYIYVFAFENDTETIDAIAGGKKEPYYFNLGIKIGTDLGNDNFLLNAYMKNIILYSRNGHHHYVREMYKKRLSVLRRPNPLREAHMLAGLGYNSIILEDYERAHTYLVRSVNNLTELEQPEDIMNSLYNLAMNHFVAEDYKHTINVIELIIKMLKEMDYHSIGACSSIKLYSLIAISCYYQEEYYNSYYFLSKIEVFVEHITMLVKDTSDGKFDEDLLLYHLVKGMLYNNENKYELCQEELDMVETMSEHTSSARFFTLPLYCVEQASLYIKQGKKDEADKVIAKGISFCEKEGFNRKKQNLIYFAEHGNRNTEPLFSEDDNLQTDHILSLAKQAGNQIKLTRREKDIKFLTVLQEAISRENMTVEDLYSNTSAVIKSSYSLDNIIILRRRNGKQEILHDNDELPIDEEQFSSIFDFFKSYRQAFLTNRSDKNFSQFLPIISPFGDERIMTMIGIPMMEESGTETVFIGYKLIKLMTIAERVLLGNDDLMILKFAVSQFCEMMRRIDSRNMIERMNKKLEQSAITDHLTGITNRNGFSRQAEIICSQANTNQNNVLLYLDLDNFKYYNDTFGHEIGDLVLVTFAEIFKRMTRDSGMAVRYGGDEFIILLYNKTAEDGVAFAESLYNEIKDGLVKSISLKLHTEIHIPDDKKISCSIGIAPFKGGSKDSLENALNKADQMLYDVKRNGKSHYKLYEDDEPDKIHNEIII